MPEPKFESNDRDEYFETISSELDTLIEIIDTVTLEDADYELLSGRATSEVSSYIQRNLIQQLAEAKKRVGNEDTDDDSVLSPTQQPKTTKTGMQKILLFSNPLQEIFASFKEVPFLTPTQYEILLQNHPDMIEVFTTFINKLEEGRKRKAGK
jgi:hypothetical protein